MFCQSQKSGLVFSWLGLPAAAKLEQDAPATIKATRKPGLHKALVLQIAELGFKWKLAGGIMSPGGQSCVRDGNHGHPAALGRSFAERGSKIVAR